MWLVGWLFGWLCCFVFCLHFNKLFINKNNFLAALLFVIYIDDDVAAIAADDSAAVKALLLPHTAVYVLVDVSFGDPSDCGSVRFGLGDCVSAGKKGKQVLKELFDCVLKYHTVMAKK